MSLSLPDYRAKLISKIMLSNSQVEVKRFIDTAMTSLEKYKLNGFIIDRFVDKTIDELETFTPMNQEPQQWSNIRMARIVFNRIRKKTQLPHP